MLEKGNFEGAAAKVEENKTKAYGAKNELLYLLDLSTALGAAHKNAQSNLTLARAQDKTNELYAKSVTQTLGTFIINDNTQPYRAPVYETALTYFFRAMDFLSVKDFEGAGVEARRAAFFLDKTRESKAGAYTDDPFVQYFASMIYEDRGQLSDARIARQNAGNAYEKYKSWSAAKAPDFPPPRNYAAMGEAVVFHYNGKAPLITSESIMYAWNDLWFTLQGNSELEDIPQSTVNAVFAGAFGRSVTVSFPKITDSPYIIETSAASAQGGEEVQTQLVADIAGAAKKTLDTARAAGTARMITRAVTKYILSVQARNAAKKLTGDDNLGSLVGALASALSNITEMADTRSWFTLPAEIRMASLWLAPGVYDIRLRFYDKQKHAIDEHLFEKVQINKGERTYLYHRTAK
jgi:hypothetical protein